MQTNEILALEEQGWHALSTAGDAGRNHYAKLLRDDAVMLLPGGLRIVGRDRILASFGTTPWDAFRIEDADVLPLGTDAAMLVYRIAAQRKGSAPYEALVSTTYVRDGSWRLVAHQQTPL